jgi:hypothetical protein
MNDTKPGAPKRGESSDSGTQITNTAGDMGSGAALATREAVGGAIRVTEDVAAGLVGGVTHVAAELIHGVRDVGYEVSDGASSLISAAGAVGGTAVHTVAGLLTEVVGGVRQVVGAAMGRNGNGQARQFGADSDRNERQFEGTTRPEAQGGTERTGAPAM